MKDQLSFKDSLTKIGDCHLSDQEANEAFYNLSGFMSLLIKVNEREKIISFEGNEHEDK